MCINKLKIILRFFILILLCKIRNGRDANGVEEVDKEFSLEQQ